MAAVLVQKTASLQFSSDPSVGAENLSPDGSSFNVSLDSPLSISSAAMSCEAAVVAATVWNTSPNIAAEFENNTFRYTTAQAPAGTFNIVIPDGLYSLDDLDAFLSRTFVNNGHPADLVQLSGDGATQKTVLSIAFTGDSVDFTAPSTVGPVLGWPAPGAFVGPAPVDNYSESSPSEATFNRVNSYIIKSDMVNTGITLNGDSRSILAGVPIDVPPGSQVVFQPASPRWFDASELIGASRQVLKFFLLDQALRPVPTANEYWTVTVQLRWNILLSSKPVPLRP